MVVMDDIEVVISGIGGKFPKSRNVQEFQENLLKNEYLFSAARWKHGQMGICDITGNIPDIDTFDNAFFGIHRQQTLFMDPMSRIGLEKTFEALVDAGTNPSEIRGKKVGAYFASTISENDSLMFENVENGFGVTGQARTMFANRISYWLNITGPSLACEANWLGGLQVLRLGYEAVRSGQCEAAIVGAANLVMNFGPMYSFKQLGVTSPDGATRAFDEHANGYGRSEGVCVLYLQRADQARRHYATIVNVDLMFNGKRSGGLGTFDLDSATRFLTNFYETAHVDPLDVHYVEAYGCGLKVVDEKEMQILDRFYNRRTRATPLKVGSVKSNAGHSEAASVMLSIVKAIIAMETGLIPANRDFETPNKNIPALINGRIEVVKENTPWDEDLIAVNGFGLISFMGHVLLRRHKHQKPEYQLDIPLLNIVSSRTEDNIKDILEQMRSEPVLDLEYSRMVNDLFSSNISGHFFRGYTIRDGEDVKDEYSHFVGDKKPVWFVYSGMGSQWLTMGKDLLQLPIFAKAVQKCHEVLAEKGLDLMHIITAEDPGIFNNILHSFVGIAAIQIGLTDMLTSLGIHPDGIVGHSVGELGCAYADGCLTAEQMILCAYYRGRASIEVTLIPGLMAAVGIGAKQMQERCPPTIDIACHNGPDSCTLSGPAEDMRRMVEELQAQGTFARLVDVAGIAYHSRYIKPAAPKLLDYLKKLISNPVARSSKWISSSVPEDSWSTPLAKDVSAEYLTNNLLSSVYFEETLPHIPKDAVVIEVAPHGLMQAILRRSLSQNCVNIPLSKRGEKKGLTFLLAAIGKMYLSGMSVNISGIYSNTQEPPKGNENRVVPRGTRSLAPLVQWAHEERWRTGLGEFKDNICYELDLPLDPHTEHFRELVGHCVNDGTSEEDEIIVPVTTYLTIICEILENIKRPESVIFHDVMIKRYRFIPRKGVTYQIRMMIQRGSGKFEVNDRYGVLVSGRVELPEILAKERLPEPSIEESTEVVEFHVESEQFYRELKNRGHIFSGAFHAVHSVNLLKEGMTAKVEWKKDWSEFLAAMIQLQIFQVGQIAQNLHMPVFIRKILVNLEEPPKENTELKVTYEHNTKIMSSSVIQIHDLDCRSFILDKKQINADSYKFIKYTPDNVFDIQTAVDICLQMVQEDEPLARNAPELRVVTLCSNNDNRTNIIQSCIKNYTDRFTTCKVELVEEDASTSLPENTTASLLIVENTKIANVFQLLKERSKYVLVCSSDQIQISLEYPITSVFKFSCNKYYYYLLKQVCNESPVIVNTKSKVVSSSDLQNKSLLWVMQLQSLLTNKQGNSTRKIYLVLYSLPINGIENFLKDIHLLQNGKYVRLIILQDSTAPECNITEPFYSTVFQKDLPVSVFKDGAWGNYFLTPLADSLPQAKETSIVPESSFSKLCPSYDIKYVGLNVSDMMTESPDKVGLGLLDYSAFDKSGKRVMGIARINQESGEMEPDPDFVWTMPDKWSFADGATIPYAYAMAYYLLMEVVDVQPGENLLITNGSSGFAQAVMNVAFSMGCTIYTTTATEKQRASLITHMKMLTPHQVVEHTRPNWEHQILDATSGGGVTVLINCLAGKNFHAALRCVGALSRVIHLVPEQPDTLDYGDTLGLSIFIRCHGMYGIEPNQICNIPDYIKRAVKQFVTEGIEKGTISPLRRNILKPTQNLKDILRYLKGGKIVGTAILPIQNFKTKTSSGKEDSVGKSDKNASYILYGEDVDTTLTAAQWLCQRGIRHLHLVLDSSSSKDSYSYSDSENDAVLKRRISLLQQYSNARITVNSSGLSQRGVRSLLPQLVAVIVLPGKEQAVRAEKAQSILAASAPNARLLCLWNPAKGLSNLTGTAPQVVNLRWDYCCSFADVLQVLKQALDSTTDVYVQGRQRDGKTVTEQHFSHKDFFSKLAMSVPSVCSVANSMMSEPDLVQIASASPHHIMENPPMFVFPGLLGANCRHLSQLLRRIMAPVYVASLYDARVSISQAAATIVQRIRAVYSKGPYNLLGVSSGGILAIEVAKLLEATANYEDNFHDPTVQLYLMDGLPDTIQHFILEIERDSTTINFDVNLLVELLHIERPEDIRALINIQDWNSRLNMAIRLFNYSKRDGDRIIRVMNMIKYRIEQTAAYKPNNQLLNCTTRLLKPTDSKSDFSFNLENYCKQMKIEVMTGNHFTILENNELFDYINENMILLPLYY